MEFQSMVDNYKCNRRLCDGHKYYGDSYLSQRQSKSRKEARNGTNFSSSNVDECIRVLWDEPDTVRENIWIALEPNSIFVAHYRKF